MACLLIAVSCRFPSWLKAAPHQPGNNCLVRTVESLQAIRLNHKELAFANRIYVFDLLEAEKLTGQ
jgi:hypothetical protein